LRIDVQSIRIWSQIQAFCYTVSGSGFAGTAHFILLSFDQILLFFFFETYMNDFKAPGPFLDSDLDSRILLNPAPIQNSHFMMRELISDNLFHNPDPPFLVRTMKADLKKMKLFKIIMTQKSTAPNTRFANTIS
jgi:hypothetical protein